MERLDKYLANSGIGTRSEVKDFLKKGRIQVNDHIVKAADTRIDPDLDRISFDGQPVCFEQYEYHMLHKPQGCVTATKDLHDSTVMDYITSSRKEKLSPVGRLDKDTEGLLLITDDGELSHRLLSPKKHVEKTYYARVTGTISTEAQHRFETGLDIGDEKPTLPATLEIVERREKETEVKVTISEGRFHQIKRMFHAIGNEVMYLKRLSMGPLILDESLPAGKSRRLTAEEINALLALK